LIALVSHLRSARAEKTHRRARTGTLAGGGIENRSERYSVMRYEAIICHNYSGSVTARIAVNLHETDNILRGDNSAPQPPIEAQTINLSWRAPTWNSTLDRANERHEGGSLRVSLCVPLRRFLGRLKRVRKIISSNFTPLVGFQHSHSVR